MSPTTPDVRARRGRWAPCSPALTVELPWWRVVRADGRIVTNKAGRQAELLRAEGVVVRDGRVVAARIGRFAGRFDRR